VRFRRVNLWRAATFGGFVAIAACCLTIEREPFDRALEQLRAFGPMPYYSAFALLISFGVPPTPFLLVAGAAFDMPTNVVGPTMSYAVSLAISFIYTKRLFPRNMEEFLAAKLPRIAKDLSKHSAIAIVIVRLTPGIPYALQNCLLASITRSFAIYFATSLFTLVPIALLYLSLGHTLTAV
jgi:uncharacterized membrane protein YdjX (TVP38/TMEM64 family)